MQISKRRRLSGLILIALSVLFLFFDGITKVIRLNPVVGATVELGYPESTVPAIGLILLLCTLVYAIPRTSVLGAILLTGYLGGAIATHVRIESPLFSHTLFPIYIAALVWGGLYLRDNRLRGLVPWRQANSGVSQS